MTIHYVFPSNKPLSPTPSILIARISDSTSREALLDHASPGRMRAPSSPSSCVDRSTTAPVVPLLGQGVDSLETLCVGFRSPKTSFSTPTGQSLEEEKRLSLVQQIGPQYGPVARPRQSPRRVPNELRCC